MRITNESNALLAKKAKVSLIESATNLYSHYQRAITKSAHEFDVVMNDETTRSMSAYKGHPVLIVNGASAWGNTDREFTQLQLLHYQYASRGVKFIVFPCNQFGSQAPLSSSEMRQFLAKYHYRGDLTVTCNVNGKDAHPLWSWMKEHKNGKGIISNDIKWNFTKFLLDQNGQVVCRVGPQTEMRKLSKPIEKLLQDRK